MTCREIPLFQKTCWTNCSKGTHSKYISLVRRKQTWFYITDCTHHPSIHPMRWTIYISWKVHASISNTEKTKYSHLDLETLTIMWRPWYWETVKQKTKYTYTVKKKKKDRIINLIYSVKETRMYSVTAWKKRTQKHMEGGKSVHKVSHKCIYSIFKFQ